jgi:DNA-binding XRE family transcriptional regulator
MIGLQRIEVGGERFVLLPEREFDRLCSRAGEAVSLADEKLPALPAQDRHGRFPALEYARISLARDIIRDRRAAGMSQRELADLVGTRQETISRIESGKQTASVKLVDKIDRVLRKAIAKRAKR